MEEDHLRSVLKKEFSPTDTDLERVTREAIELYQSGKFEEDSGNELTVELIKNKLKEADRPIRAGWNWWRGALDYIHNGYERFQV
jgi:hypothetical protein